jgi:hypothetical protein
MQTKMAATTASAVLHALSTSLVWNVSQRDALKQLQLLQQYQPAQEQHQLPLAAF